MTDSKPENSNCSSGSGETSDVRGGTGRTATGAWIDRHQHPWSKDLGFISDLRWTRDEVEGEGTPLYAAPPTALLLEVMEALDLLTELHDAMGLPQGLARTKSGAALVKLREQLGEQG